MGSETRCGWSRDYLCDDLRLKRTQMSHQHIIATRVEINGNTTAAIYTEFKSVAVRNRAAGR